MRIVYPDQMRSPRWRIRSPSGLSISHCNTHIYEKAYTLHVISYEALAIMSGRCGLHWIFRTAYSWPINCVSHVPPTAAPASGPDTSPSFTIRQSHTRIVLSTPALARTNGRYLFQSIESISPPEAGTVSAAAVNGAVNELLWGANDDVRRSKILTVPSVEPVARISPW